MSNLFVKFAETQAFICAKHKLAKSRELTTNLFVGFIIMTILHDFSFCKTGTIYSCRFSREIVASKKILRIFAVLKSNYGAHSSVG